MLLEVSQIVIAKCHELPPCGCFDVSAVVTEWLCFALGVFWGMPWVHRGKATKQMTKYNVLRSLGMREYGYFISSSGCLVEVLQWHIEVVDALVDVVCAAVLNT